MITLLFIYICCGLTMVIFGMLAIHTKEELLKIELLKTGCHLRWAVVIAARIYVVIFCFFLWPYIIIKAFTTK